MRVLLADAQPFIRRGLLGLLSETFPNWSFRQVGSRPQALEYMATGSGRMDVDLAIIDLDLLGGDGSASIRALRKANAALRILVLTSTSDWNTVLSGLAAGVHGYLLKVDAFEQLLHAVRTVLSGGVYVPARLPERSSAAGPLPAVSGPSVMADLTTRQQEVLTLLADGQSTKDIARNLNLGIGTVKVHLGGIYRVLSVPNRSAAVAWFHSAGLPSLTRSR
ncbi:MAG: response regulator transcription factor [Acetobacteraceae bacterium]|nr:response regulator transcription factor [Acetobacteraceae bacterium]